jgi:hypothetical protein
MIRSHWTATVALAVASAGLARGQATPADAAGPPKDHFVTIQEVGTKPLRCKLLKSWYEPDGTKAYQVQSVSTGEMISILETPTGQAVAPGSDKGRAEASRIVHWGVAKHPPFGTPEAPADATVLGTPMPDPTARLAKTPQPLQPYTVKDPPAGGWPEAYAHEAPKPKPVSPTPSAQMTKSVVTSPTSAPVATLATRPAATPAASVAKQNPVNANSGPAVSRITTSTTTAPAVKPAPATTTAAPVVKPAPASTTVAPVVKQTLANPVAAPIIPPAPAVTANPAPIVKFPVLTNPGPSPATTTTSAPAVSKLPVTTNSVMAPAKAPVIAPAASPLPVADVKTAEPTKPAASDWRQSWGKVEEPKSPLLKSAATPTIAPRKVDPLQDPESYSKVSVDDRIAKKLKETSAKGADKSVTETVVKSTVDAPTPPPTAKALPVGFQPAGAALMPPATNKPATPVTPAPVTSNSTSSLQKPWLPGVPEAPIVAAPAKTPPTPTASISVKAPAATTASASPTASTKPTTVMKSTPTPAAPPKAPAVTTSTPTPAAVPMLAPPPGVPTAPGPYVPAYVSAASTAATDNSGNAFSAPKPAPKSNAGTPLTAPPTISRMPGYTPVPGVAYASEPPPRIAAAPSASVVAAGYPLVAPAPRSAPPQLNPNITAETAANSKELLIALRTSLYPSQREWAADRLTSCDWRAEPQVVDGLVTTARVDPAPMVRCGCLRALARMQASCPPAVAVAKDLKNDADPRVRQEAEQALNTLMAKRPARVSN